MAHFPIRHWIFDWSGTLVDDVEPVLRATNGIFAHFGKAAFTRESFLASFQLPFTRFYEEFLPGRAQEEIEPLYVKHFGDPTAGVFALPHARETLDLCRQGGGVVLLLSSTKTAHFEDQAAHLGLSDSFDRSYTEVWDKRQKIREVLEAHRLDPRETAFVGDMRHDIETAKYGQVTSVAVLTGYESVEKIATADPDFICHDLAAVQRLILGASLAR